MQYDNRTMSRQYDSVLAVNSVLRNTYLLLGLTLLFSAVTAGFAMATNAAPLGALITLVGYFGLLFLTNYLRNSVWGLVSVFALTGFMGYTLGPILNLYIHHFANGHEFVMTALGGTGLTFFGLSAYALVSRKDFSFMAKFVMVGVMVAFVMGLANIFLHMPAMMLASSAMFIVLSSAIILIQTSQIINGGETNYIMATITLYVSLYNIFLSLLNILGFFNSND